MKVIVTAIAQAQIPMTTARRVKRPLILTSRRAEANNRMPVSGGRSGQGQEPRSLIREARSAGRQRSLRSVDGGRKSMSTVLPRYLDRVPPKALGGKASPGPAIHVDKMVIKLVPAPTSRRSSVDGSVSVQAMIRFLQLETGCNAYKPHDHRLLFPFRGEAER